jgi:hypothetical protein
LYTSKEKHMTLSRHTLAAGIAALSLALSAGPALASGGSGSGGGGTGGGGGGGTTATAPPVGQPWSLCPEYATVGFYTQPDGSVLFANEIGGIGCLIARNSGGLLSINEVRTGTGWVSTIKSSDPQKLDVQFTWPPTGTKHEITVQPGKTVVR